MPNRRLYDVNFALAFVCNLCFIMANALMVHFARWVAFLGGDEVTIGWIMGIGAVSGVLVRPLLGRWIDRLGARSIWATGYVLFAVVSLTFLTVDRVGPWIFFLRALLMCAPAMIFISTLAYLTHTTAPDRLAESIGTFGASGFMGIAMGPWLGDMLLAGSQVDRSSTQFTMLFLIAAGLMLLGLTLIPLLRADPPHPEARAAPYFQSLRRYWPGPMLMVCFVFGCFITLMFNFLTRFADVRGLSQVGFWFFTTYGVVALVTRVGLRKLPEQIGNARQVRLGLLVMAAGLFCFWGVSIPAGLMLPAALCGLAHSLIFHPMMSMVVSRFPNHLRGTGSATAFIALDGGVVLGSPVLGFTADTLGFAAMFGLVAVLCLLVIAAVPRIAPAPLPVSESA